jgi:hypothetical protein
MIAPRERGRPIWHSPVATAALQNLIEAAEHEADAHPGRR